MTNAEMVEIVRAQSRDEQSIEIRAVQENIRAMCRDARIALTAAADALEREQWHPIGEMHEDHGTCIVYDMVNGGEPAFLDVCEDDFAETAKEYTHFRRLWLTTEEVEALNKERA